ncbi:MAG: hypothetical protein IJY22_05870 [Clostridia bacterium]|nr:hypothetical protein [Clostridia bacterium]
MPIADAVAVGDADCLRPCRGAPIGGDPLSRDEVPQEEAPKMPDPEPEGFFVCTDVTMKDAYYDEKSGYFRVTAVNHTDAEIYTRLNYYVQKRVADEWVYVLPSKDANREFWHFPVGESRLALPAVPLEQLPGEFRLLLGITGSIRVVEDEHGAHALAFERGAELLTCNVIVTEPPRLGEIVVKDGLPQNTLVSMEITTEAPTVNTNVLYRRLQNRSSYVISHFTEDRIEYNKDGEWVAATPIKETLDLHRGIGVYVLSEHKMGLRVGDYRMVCKTKYDFYVVAYFSLAADSEPTKDRLPDSLRPPADLPAGELIELDGLLQNSLITAEMVEIDTSLPSTELEWRLNNESSTYVYYLLNQRIQIRRGDEWIDAWEQESYDGFTHLRPWQRFFCYVPPDRELEAGAYRLVADTGYGFYVVCYFSVGE